jgi:protein phosphatase
LIVNGRLKRRLTTVVDATNLRAANRKGYKRTAARYGVPTVALAFNLSATTYHARNSVRSARFVNADVVDDQAARMPTVIDELALEGYALLKVVGDADLVDGIDVERLG